MRKKKQQPMKTEKRGRDTQRQTDLHKKNKSAEKRKLGQVHEV